VVEPQGGRLDDWRTRSHIGRAAAWLGSAEGDLLVDPDTTPEEPEIGYAGRGGRIKKSSRTLLPKKPRSTPENQSRSATDEHRIGLKPITRRVWAPIGKHPVAP